MRFQLPWSWRTYVSFCLLAYLVGATHEIAHHLAGFLTSGHFGHMSFNLFASAENHPYQVLVSLAGPAITYSAAWIGATLVLRRERPVLGYALVAGSSCYMRLVGVLSGGGDESVASRALTGTVYRWPLVAIVAGLVLPPILIAFHSLGNRRRVVIFISSMFGPFFPLIFVRMADQRWFAANVIAPELFQQPVFAGIPVVVLAADLLALCLFLAFGWKLLQEESRPNVAGKFTVRA